MELPYYSKKKGRVDRKLVTLVLATNLYLPELLLANCHDDVPFKSSVIVCDNDNVSTKDILSVNKMSEYGIYIVGSGNKIINEAQIQLSDANVTAIYAIDKSKQNLFINNKSIISNQGSNTRAIQASDNNFYINNGTIELSDVGSYGVISGTTNKINNNSLIKLKEFGSTGIYITGDHNEITNDGIIHLFKLQSYGIRAMSEAHSNLFNNNGSILLEDSHSVAIDTGLKSLGNNIVNNKGEINLLAQGFGVLASKDNVIHNKKNGNIFINDANSTGVFLAGGKNEIINEGEIVLQGKKSIAIRIAGEGENKIINHHLISLQGNQSEGILLDSNTIGNNIIINHGLIELKGSESYGQIIRSSDNYFENANLGVISLQGGNAVLLSGSHNKYINNGKINLYAANSVGINLSDATHHEIQNNHLIKLKSPSSIGIQAQGTKPGFHQINNQGQIQLDGQKSIGIFNHQSNNTLFNSLKGIIEVDSGSGILSIGESNFIKNNGIIILKNHNSHAMHIKDSASNIIQNNNLLELKSDESTGIKIEGSIIEQANQIENNGSIKLLGQLSSGISNYQSNNHFVNAELGIIDNEGNDSKGIFVEKTSKNSLINDGIIINQGESNQGVLLHSVNQSDIINNKLIEINGDNSQAISLGGNNHFSNNIINNGTLSLKGEKNEAIFIHSNSNIIKNNTSGNILLKGPNSTGIFSIESDKNQFINQGYIVLEDDNSQAISIFNNTNNVINNEKNIILKGLNSKGIVLEGENKAKANHYVSNTDSIYLAGKNSQAIFISQSYNKLDNLGTIELEGPHSTAIVLKEGTNNNINNEGSLLLKNKNSLGIHTQNGFSSKLQNNHLIHLLESHSMAIKLDGNASALGNNHITNHGKILLEGNNSVGIQVVQGNNTIDNTALGKINLNNRESIAVYLAAGVNNKFINQGSLLLANEYSKGIYLLNSINNKIINHKEIELRGDYSNGFYIGGLASANSSHHIINSGNLLLSGNNSNGIWVNQVNNKIKNDSRGAIELLGDNSLAVTIQGSHNQLANDGIILLEGTNAQGIGVQSDGFENEIINNQLIVLKGNNSIGLILDGKSNQFLNKGKLTLEGNNLIGISFLGKENLGINDNLVELKGKESIGISLADNSQRNRVVNHQHIKMAGTKATGILLGGKENNVINAGNIDTLLSESIGIAISGEKNEVMNSGEITAASNAITFKGNQNKLINNNLINNQGEKSYAIYIESEPHSKNYIHNLTQGIIQSDKDKGIVGTSGSVLIDNAGLIKGIDKALALGPEDDIVTLRKTGLIQGIADGGDYSDLGNQFVFDQWQGVWGESSDELILQNWQRIDLQNRSGVMMIPKLLSHSEVQQLWIDGTSSLNGSLIRNDYRFPNATIFNEGIINLTNQALGDRLVVKNFALKNKANESGSIFLESSLDKASDTDRIIVLADMAENIHIPLIISNLSQNIPQVEGKVETGAFGNTALDGASVVQVAGKAYADSFILPGGYVAHGPYQAKLNLFSKEGEKENDLQKISNLQEQDPLFGEYGIKDSVNDYRLQVALEDNLPIPIPQIAIEKETLNLFFHSFQSIMGTYHERQINRLSPKNKMVTSLQSNFNVNHRLNSQANSLIEDIFIRTQFDKTNYTSRNNIHYHEYLNFIQGGFSFLNGEFNNNYFNNSIVVTYAVDRVNSLQNSSKGRLKMVDLAMPITLDALNKNYYLDIVPHINFNRIQYMTAERGDSGQTHGLGVGVSIESGKEYRLNNELTFMPQFQLQYHHLNLKDFIDIDSTTVQGLEGNSLLGRLGIQVQKTIFNKIKYVKNLTPYARLDVLHEFINGQNIEVANIKFDSSLHSTRLETTLGIKAESSYGSVYLQGKYQTPLARTGFQGWTGTLGLSYDF